MEIRSENNFEQRETEHMIREAFWNVYCPECTEHYILHMMRKSPAFVSELNLVAVDKDKVIGHVISLKSHIAGDDGNIHEVLSLGPIAVLPSYQKTGIGSRLIARTKEIASSMGYRAILLCGDPAYYSKQGFEAAEKHGIRTSENMFADALQIYILCESAQGNLSGRYYEDSVYDVDEEEVKEFDKSFPPKNPVSDTPSQRLFLEIVSRCRSFENESSNIT